MTTSTAPSASAGDRNLVRARPSGFLGDLITIAKRALRSIPREPETFVPALFVPTFFFIVNVGALQNLTEGFPGNEGFDYRAFQLPTAIIFAVTGVSRAPGLVTDIQSGYFDRLLLSPARRLPLLLGLMVADLVLVIGLCIPVLILGFVFGVSFGTGVLGVLVFILIGALWGVAYTGLPYAIALKTANPGAVGASFILFFPFAFLTGSTVPLDQLSGWLRTVARYNPITHILESMRSLTGDTWEWAEIGKGLLAILIVAVVSQGLALAALRGRLDRG
ncbi:MAG: ABC transporter permease [Actinomycetota bacterium]